MDMRRWLDEHGPDYPEAHVALIDALRAYVRCYEQLIEELLVQETITAEDASVKSPHISRCKALLGEIEDKEFDPTLCGVIQR